MSAEPEAIVEAKDAVVQAAHSLAEKLDALDKKADD